MPISSQELRHFITSVFVECGSAAEGRGITAALNAGFPEVQSVEINRADYIECYTRFKDDSRVNLSCGDCGLWLETVLNMIGEQCTVYLDANGYAGETESPFQASIEALVKHQSHRNGRNDHILLVDDINHERRPRGEILKDLRSPDYYCGSYMIRQLRRVNPEYTFYLIDTHSEDLTVTYESWVLVADPVKNRFPLAAWEYV